MVPVSSRSWRRVMPRCCHIGPQETTGRPIIHTERFFGGRPEIKVPSLLEGSVLKGELYASPKGGGALGPQDVGTLLNSSIARSLQIQKERGLQLKNMLYDVQQYGKRPIDPTVTPRADRRKMLEEILTHLPQDKFHASEEAHGPEEAAKLWHTVRSGQHPLTEEGLVVHPRVGVPSKAKLMEEHDVHLTGTFPGEGKRQATVGGFTYGHEPGKTVGKVGTGFSDDFLKEVARDPSAYTGRVARLRAQQKLPSGALRHPVFIGLHEDTNKIAGAYWDPAPGLPDNPIVDDGQPMPERRHRRPPLPPPPMSWLDALRQGLWGTPNSLLPEAIRTIEEEEKVAEVALFAKTADDAGSVLNMPPATKPPPANPTPTSTALGQLAARPALAPLPANRAVAEQSKIFKMFTGRRHAADQLAGVLHGAYGPRAALTAASRAGGYPADPAAAPASTVKLLGEMYPHKLPPTTLVHKPTGVGEYRPMTGRTTISDPPPGTQPGWMDWLRHPLATLQQGALEGAIPNRLGIARHETEHALQGIDKVKSLLPWYATPAEQQRESKDLSNAIEVPPSLGDLPFMAQAHKLETGKPLNAPVEVAPGITHDADWMARQAEQHGMFKGRTTTELLATQAGQAYLKRLLDAQPPPQPPITDRLWNWGRSWLPDGNVKKGEAGDQLTGDATPVKPITPAAAPLPKPTKVPIPPAAAQHLAASRIYPSPTGRALASMSTPGQAAFPRGRAAPALTAVQRLMSEGTAGERYSYAGNALAQKLHESNFYAPGPRQQLVAASRKAGYPADPAAAPASTVDLLRRTYPHQLPPTELTEVPGEGSYSSQTGKTTISDPLPPRPGQPSQDNLNLEREFQQAIEQVSQNRLGTLWHETEHALQDDPEIAKLMDASTATRREYNNAQEIAASLGDLPYIAQVHKLETGKPLNELVFGPLGMPVSRPAAGEPDARHHT